MREKNNNRPGDAIGIPMVDRKKSLMQKTTGKILIVDDNEELLIALRMILSPHFGEIKTEKNPNLILSLIERESFDIILLDMNFKAGINTGNEGIFWMNKILEIDPDSTIVFITAYGDIELAVKSIKEGAADFIQKSWDQEKILSTIMAAYNLRQSKLEILRLKTKQSHLKEKIDRDYEFCTGESQIMQDLSRIIEKVAPTDANILIMGESGTGKEVIAREIHKLSARSDEIFVNVDLGSLSETLFESELFGYVKGAFTDAKEDKPGRFEIASGGTLFLDEIGNLTLPLQSKLLTAIQNRQVIRLGSNSPVPVDIRLICATNKPLFEMAEKGQFREDLIYRINTVQIEIPPLRDRPEDIPQLANFFLRNFREKYHKNDLVIGK
ncbi:MAG: sigma-54-dependent Fis family transcriptional regulator, partial [Bacteroidales bacterium]